MVDESDLTIFSFFLCWIIFVLWYTVSISEVFIIIIIFLFFLHLHLLRLLRLKTSFESPYIGERQCILRIQEHLYFIPLIFYNMFTLHIYGDIVNILSLCMHMAVWMYKICFFFFFTQNHVVMCCFVCASIFSHFADADGCDTNLSIFSFLPTLFH